MRTPWLRRLGLACVALMVLSAPPGCGPEGTGSIEIDRSPESRVMVHPDRKAPGLPGAGARGGQSISRTKSPER